MDSLKQQPIKTKLGMHSELIIIITVNTVVNNVVIVNNNKQPQVKHLAISETRTQSLLVLTSTAQFDEL